MGYNDVFGGGSINPAQRTYLDLTISADVVLQWPIEQQIGGDDVAVDIIDVTATTPGLNVDFSDARQVSTGYTSLITNVGFDDFTVRDSAGGTIITPIGGTAWFIYLTDNSTAAGVWRTFQLGATVSVAAAAALAGAGLKAIMTKLNQTLPPTLIGAGSSPLNMTDADRAQLNIWNGGVGTFNLPDPATVGSDWFTYIRNGGTGVLTISTPLGLIDGNINLILNPGVSGIFITDGSDWFTVGLTSALDTGFDFIEVNVAGGGDFVLSGVQLDRVAYRFIGALTAGRKIIVPNTIQEYWVDNNTTGAFALEVATAAQVTPVGIPQGNRVILYCDGVNVLDAESSVVTFPITIAQGGTGAISAPGARTNLGVPPNTRAIIAGEGLDGTGTLAADITFNVALAGLTIAVPDAADFLVFQDIDDLDLSRKATIADVVAAASGDVSQLVIGGNVRADAQALGILQLRSTGNVDAEVRVLEYTHQDGTPVALVGQPGSTLDFVIAHLINDASSKVTVSLPILAEFAVEVGSVLHLRVPSGGTRFGGSLDNNAQVFWTDTGGLDRANLGFPTSDTFLFDNQLTNPGVAFRFQGEDSGTITRTMLEMNPNTGPTLFESGAAVARVLPAASGGMEVNNLSTGPGFQRVLTTADLGGGGGYRGAKAYQFGVGSWPLNNTPNFAAGGPPGLSEGRLIMQTVVFDTEGSIISVPNSRFITPAGVSKVILRAGYVINGDTSGGYRHLRFRLNGTLFLDPLQGNWVSQTTNSAAGSGSWWGGIATSGVITVANPGTDYFEAWVLRQNSSGFTIANTVWMEMEIIA